MNAKTLDRQKKFHDAKKVQDQCRDILRKKFPKLEDHTENRKKMDWRNPETGEAIEFKFVDLARYGGFTISQEKVDLYLNDVKNSPDTEFGSFWILDRMTGEEYRIQLSVIDCLIQTGIIKPRKNRKSREQHESGIFYCVPIKYLTNITNSTHSLSSYITL